MKERKEGSGVRRKKRESEPKKRLGRKLKALAAAAVLAVGVGVNKAVDPKELIRAADKPAPSQYSELEPAPAAEEIIAYTEEEEGLGPADRARRRFIRLPVGVKALALLPLWAMGALPAAMLTALTPVWSALLGLGLQGAVLAALFALVYKLLFPKAKLRELFRPRKLRWLLLGALAVTVLDLLLGQFWAEWPLARAALVLAAGFGVLCLLWRRLCGGLKAPEPARVRTRLSMEY